ncbi:hypothetical protein ACJW31_02G143900 [Castanea mollissima]
MGQQVKCHINQIGLMTVHLNHPPMLQYGSLQSQRELLLLVINVPIKPQPRNISKDVKRSCHSGKYMLLFNIFQFGINPWPGSPSLKISVESLHILTNKPFIFQPL